MSLASVCFLSEKMDYLSYLSTIKRSFLVTEDIPYPGNLVKRFFKEITVERPKTLQQLLKVSDYSGTHVALGLIFDPFKAQW
jgi:hypothetical protein